MHDAVLSQAALPAPVFCYGRPLRPYSLGHELWLVREQNAILRAADKPPYSIDVLRSLPGAVLICSRTWEELRTMRAERWLGLDLWLWRKRTRKLDVAHETEKFVAYRAAGLLEFPLSTIVRPDRGPTPRLPGGPFILRLQQWLMRELRFSEAAAWDYPVGLAKMRWATHWEQEGGLDIYNAHDAEFDVFVAEQEAKK